MISKLASDLAHPLLSRIGKSQALEVEMKMATAIAAKRSLQFCALVFLSILCLCHHAGAKIVDDDNAARVLELNDKTFEHDTQAATGQTTGVW